MSSKTSCFACDSQDILGIFKCEGCEERFCFKHANEHRDYLRDQLDELIFEHATICQTSHQNELETSILIEQINQWEKTSIETIQKTARDTREQFQRLIKEEKERMQEKFSQMKSELVTARLNHEYLENDLARWNILLEKLAYDFNHLCPAITLQQDDNHLRIPRLVIDQMNRYSIFNESLISDSKYIQFDDQHHLAMHYGPYRIPVYITGTREYSTGQHQIRFFIRKKTNAFTLSFNIMSKLMDLSSTDDVQQYLTYGWQSDDCINPSQSYPLKEKIQADLRGKTKFHIRLLLDCDNHTVAYVNEKTKRRKELHVDLNKCPLPWKLHFYLYDVGDTVRLLSSSSSSSS